MRTIILLLLASAAPALAQPAPAPSPAPVDALRICLSATPQDRRSCIGAVSDACQERPEGSSTVGIGECLGEEGDAWDILLNGNYRAALSRAAEVDDGLGDAAAHSSLVKAQRAWIAFREAECGRLYDLNREGTIRSVVFAGCMLQMTAERALALMPEDL